MTTGLLERLELKVQYIRENIGTLTGVLIQEYEIEYELCQLNRNQLYEYGINSEGDSLIPYKNLHYAEMKFNLRGKELTDLFLSGEFQRNFFIEVNGEIYSFSSTDEKTGVLVTKYGDNIFGLTNDNKQKAYFIIKPRLQETVYEILRMR